MGRNDGAERDPSSSPCFMLEWRRELSFTGLQIIGSAPPPHPSPTTPCTNTSDPGWIGIPGPDCGSILWLSAARLSSITARVTGPKGKKETKKERKKEISRHSRWGRGIKSRVRQNKILRNWTVFMSFPLKVIDLHFLPSTCLDFSY